MKFKDQMYQVVQNTTNKELLSSYQILRTGFEDNVSKFKENLSDTECELFDRIILEGVEALIEYSERLYFEITFGETNKVWRELIFTGDLCQLLDLGRDLEEV